MGTSFFWFYDIVLLAIAAGVTFRSMKKGAVSIIISTAAIIISFILAYIGSTAVSDKVYDSYIKEPLTGYIDEQLSGVMGNNLITDIQKVDMSKAVISGKFLGSMELTPDSAGKITLDLSHVDLTETGIENADLSMFGIKNDFDYSLVKIGTVEITQRELEKNSIESIVLARVLTANLKSGEMFTAFESIGEKISEALPMAFNSYADEIKSGNSEILYKLVLSAIDFSFASRGDAIISNVIEPIVIVPVKVILFLVIFTVCAALLEAIASATKLINKIPVISSVNELAGALLGLLKSFLILLVISVLIQFLISVTGNTLVFINTETIENTILFKYIYNIDIFGILW